MLLGCDPGDIFTVRNVANLVPPADRDQGHHGVLAAIQFAVDQLCRPHHRAGPRALRRHPCAYGAAAGAGRRAGLPEPLDGYRRAGPPARAEPDAGRADAERRRACELSVHPDLAAQPGVAAQRAAGAGGRHADPAWLVFRPGGGRFAGILAARGRLPAHRLPLVHGACMTPVFGIAGRSGSEQDHPDRSHAAAAAARGLAVSVIQAQPPRFRDGAARQDSARFRRPARTR